MPAAPIYPTRIDPITGCRVLTTMGFFAMEADQEGKGRTAGELMSDFFQDMADDDQRVIDNYKRNTPDLLFMLAKSCLDNLDCWTEEETWVTNNPLDFEGKPNIISWDKPHFIINIHSVLEANCGGGYSGSNTKLLCHVLCEDGIDRYIAFYESISHATMSDPGDWESDMVFFDNETDAREQFNSFK